MTTITQLDKTRELIGRWDDLKENLPADHAEAASQIYDAGDLLADALEAMAGEVERLGDLAKANAKASFDMLDMAKSAEAERDSLAAQVAAMREVVGAGREMPAIHSASCAIGPHYGAGTECTCWVGKMSRAIAALDGGAK